MTTKELMDFDIAMNVDQIEQQLRSKDFYIDKIRKIPHGNLIDLHCGPVIHVFENDTVMVQGNFRNDTVYVESMPLLKAILPEDTKWHVGVKK
jgi:hypothetical protein